MKCLYCVVTNGKFFMAQLLKLYSEPIKYFKFKLLIFNTLLVFDNFNVNIVRFVLVTD